LFRGSDWDNKVQIAAWSVFQGIKFLAEVFISHCARKRLGTEMRKFSAFIFLMYIVGIERFLKSTPMPFNGGGTESKFKFDAPALLPHRHSF